jgi:hypothetical protein
VQFAEGDEAQMVECFREVASGGMEPYALQTRAAPLGNMKSIIDFPYGEALVRFDHGRLSLGQHDEGEP